jgi:hypothetical protein
MARRQQQSVPLPGGALRVGPGNGFRPPNDAQGQPQRQYQRLDFTKGVDESQDITVLPNGLLAVCKNWTPEPSGALRTRRQWQRATNVVHTPDIPFASTVMTRGMAFVGGLVPNDFLSNSVWMVGVSTPGGSGKSFTYAVDGSLSGSQWRQIHEHDNIPLVNDPEDLDHVPFVFTKGTGNVMYSHPKIRAVASDPGVYKWGGSLGDLGGFIANSPQARALTYHKSRFFAGGGPHDSSQWPPYRLYFTDTNKAVGWAGNGDPPAGNNYLDILAADGMPIEDLVTFGQNLIIAKRTNCVLLSGNTIDATQSNVFQQTVLTFAGGMGRCLVPTPQGLVVLGDDVAWLWNGGNAQIISKGVQQSYELGSGWPRSGYYSNGIVYVAQAAPGAPSLAVDMQSSAWWMEDLEGGNEIYCIAGNGQRLAAGPRAATDGLTGPLIYRDSISGLRIRDFEMSSVGQNEVFTALSPRYYISETQQSTLRHLYLRVRQRGVHDVLQAGPTVTVFRDDIPMPAIDLATPGADKVTEQRIDLSGVRYSWQLRFDYTISSDDQATFDIEAVTLALDMSAAR